MRALAEFIMRGRAQAIGVVLAGNLIPAIGPGALALVTLRRGSMDGALLLVVALIIPVVQFALLPADAEAYVFVGIFGALWSPIAVFASAQVLRFLISWPWSLLVNSLISAVAGLSLVVFFDAQVQAMLDWYLNTQQQREAQGLGSFKELLQTPLDIAGLIAFITAAVGLVGLVIGRWWQAALYNPGGFRQEFLQLRLPPSLAALCLGAALLCLSQQGLQYWSLVAALPLLVASVSMAHVFAAANGLGITWLVVFYLALSFTPFAMGMVLLSFVDSWWNIRDKLAARNNKNNRDQ